MLIIGPLPMLGMIATRTDRVISSNKESTLEKDNGDVEQVKILEKQTVFGDFVVWDHEAVPTNDDAFIKGVEEWVRFAEVVRLLPLASSPFLILDMTV